MQIKKYLVIGNPIKHSLSPKLHNHWLKENSINAIYDKIKLEESKIKNLIYDIKHQKIAGCNVTVPFKKTVIPFLDKLSLEAKETQSVNTVMFDNGRVVGHNTDIAGFEMAINRLNFDIKEKRILVLGAGGVVPSIIFALKKMKVSEITISNRTRFKAENLRNQFSNLKILDWGNLIDFDVIINATSIGLNDESLGLNFPKTHQNKLFYDVIYNPIETNFLKQGKELGYHTENGKLMFVYQAFEAFKLWHGIEPKINRDTIEILNND